MKNDFDIRQIANDAFATFPPLAEDDSAACNFAQRMLTKTISESRKSGNEISDAQARSLRDELDAELAAIDHVKISSVTGDAAETTGGHPLPSADASEITDIISSTFHTSTDGARVHLAHLKHTALERTKKYLTTTDAGFIERRQFMKRAKEIVERHLADIRKGTEK